MAEKRAPALSVKCHFNGKFYKNLREIPAKLVASTAEGAVPDAIRCARVLVSLPAVNSSPHRRQGSRRGDGPIAQLPGIFGLYFYDLNGIRLEFACQPDDGEAPGVIICVTQTKAEARAELATLRESRLSGSKSVSLRCRSDRTGLAATAETALERSHARRCAYHTWCIGRFFKH